MREITIKWLDEAYKNPPGTKIYIPASSKKEQEMMLEAIRKEINILRQIDPQKAVTLSPGKMFRQGRFWVVIERIMAIPTLGFIKRPGGKVEKIQLDAVDQDRYRRIKLMCEDGMSLEMIAELEGPLSDDEVAAINTLKEG